jgi:hypothetical protein
MKTKDFKSVKDAKAAAQHQLRFYNEMMAKKRKNEESISSKYIGEEVAKEMQPFYDAFGGDNSILPLENTQRFTDEQIEDAVKEMKPSKKLFVVDTLVTYRNRYVIEAESLEHAYDEVTMLDSGDDEDLFEPFSQKALPEQIIDGRKISKKKFDKMILELEETGEGSPWMGEKLIRKINYGEDS